RARLPDVPALVLAVLRDAQSARTDCDPHGRGRRAQLPRSRRPAPDQARELEDGDLPRAPEDPPLDAPGLRWPAARLSSRARPQTGARKRVARSRFARARLR